MKIKSLILILSILSAALSPLSLMAGDGTVTLIHIGDIHGHLIPRPHFRQGDPDYGKQVGGLAYLYDQIKKIRHKHPNSLLINTGDTIQGSAEALYSEGQAIVQGNWEAHNNGSRIMVCPPCKCRGRVLLLCLPILDIAISEVCCLVP